MGKREEYIAVLQNNRSKMTTQEGRKLPQYISAIAVSIGSAVIGSILAWTSPTVPLLLDRESLAPLHGSDSELAWVASLVPVGAIFGALPAGLFANLIGRKMTMIVFSFLAIASWAVIILADTVKMLLYARFFSGVFAGVISTVAPMYVSEIAEVSIRGGLGSYFQLFMTLGILFTYAFGAFENYLILGYASLGLSILFTMVLFVVPESPVYLINKNKIRKAENSLRKLRGDEYDISLEISELRKNLERSSEQTFSFNKLASKANCKALIIGFGLMVFQQLSGINAVIFYSATIFQDAGSSLSSSICSIIVGVIQCIATWCSGLLMDRAGRRPLLLVSDILMAVGMGALGYNFYLKEHGFDVSNIGWVPLTSLVVFIIVFSLGLGPIPWMMASEVFSPEIKGFATGTAVALNWIQTFVVTRFFGDMTKTIGNSYTFWIFSLICIIGTIFIFALVPETKGKSLQEIQDELAGRKPNEKMRINGTA